MSAGGIGEAAEDEAGPGVGRPDRGRDHAGHRFESLDGDRHAEKKERQRELEGEPAEHDPPADRAAGR